jgi:hypothetical protein
MAKLLFVFWIRIAPKFFAKSNLIDYLLEGLGSTVSRFWVPALITIHNKCKFFCQPNSDCFKHAEIVMHSVLRSHFPHFSHYPLHPHHGEDFFTADQSFFSYGGIIYLKKFYMSLKVASQSFNFSCCFFDYFTANSTFRSFIVTLVVKIFLYTPFSRYRI